MENDIAEIKDVISRMLSVIEALANQTRIISKVVQKHEDSIAFLTDLVTKQAVMIVMLETVVTRLKTQNEERARHINLASLN